MPYMRTVSVCVDQKHPLFEYADKLTRLANNLSNAARFRQRQVMTAVSKPEEAWTQNERDVMDEIAGTIREMAKPAPMPEAGSHFLSYRLLDAVMKHTGNPDYYAEGLPRQTAQLILKKATKDMKAFYASCRAYKESPSSFTGKPKLPGYKRKGGHATADISNQDCVIRTRDGKWYAELPFVKKTPVCIGSPIPGARLKQASVVPENGRYRLAFAFEAAEELPKPAANPKRACAVDLGVDNFMAVTNNCGLPLLLYKGGPVKSVNQLYNKKIAAIVSEQTLRTGGKFVPGKDYYAATNRRNDQVSDFLHKCAKHLVTWCVENRIDAIVIGVNKLWKQESGLGHKNNQEFVQLPFEKLRGILKYLCEWNGILYLEQEESYTSKASFPDMDPIPVYKEGDGAHYAFSGKRRPTRYAGMYKKDGFRGLYTAGDGAVINSDFNGSANILRKAFPQAFVDGAMPDFTKATIIRHPGLGCREANREKQLEANASNFKDGAPRISKAKQKRLRRKGNAPQAAVS